MNNETGTLSAHSAHHLAAILAKDLGQASSTDLQILHEMAGVDAGVERFEKTLLDPNLRLSDTAAGRKIFNETISLLIPAIRAAQDIAIEGIANGGKGVRPVWWWYISFVAPEKLAYITMRAILGVRMASGSVGRKASGICMDIGLAVKQQVEFEKWLSESKRTAKETGGRDLAAQLVRRAKNFNQRQWGNWTRKIDSIETLDWRRDTKMHIGSKLLELALQHTGGFFTLTYVQIRNKTERQVFLSDPCRAMIDDIHSRVEVMSPVIKPMRAAPKLWAWEAEAKKYKGGYYMLDVEFIRGGLHKHTASLDDPISQVALDAANILGQVPWAIDKPALTLGQEVYNSGLDLIEYLPKPDPIALPQRKNEQEWEVMDNIERAAWKYNLSKIHGQNARDVSKRESAIRKFHIAEEHKELVVYHPVKMDTRTRFYYVTPDWNPQGDGLARGTMRFANATALGDRGLYWLAVRLCNTFGYDKVTFEEMQVWAKEHHDLIVDSALQPLDGWRFWADADSPLEFFQTCVEWSQATGMTNPAKFMCSLPVHQDGSNNGLQLMSLIGRDPIGAKLTNCSADPVRYDIYAETAEVVKRLINEDIMAGVKLEEAQRWVGKVDRSVCKRACMTTSYGVTPRGIQDQLMSDGHCDKVEGDKLKNAGYMRDKLVEALSIVVVASRPIMNYFQGVAVALAEFDIPMRWKTPAGSIVQQSYWNVAKSDVKTVMGSYFMWDENPLGGLNLRKQQLSSSPNIIHSIDASLMQIMVRKLYEKGVEDIACIHDSFAVAPAHVDTMRDTIREVALDMFKGDWIRDEFHPYVQSYSKSADLPEPPAQGSFDVNEVISAKYFFA
jgi:DNA-directed RNA polymerase, mitochondrial